MAARLLFLDVHALGIALQFLLAFRGLCERFVKFIDILKLFLRDTHCIQEMGKKVEDCDISITKLSFCHPKLAKLVDNG